jgi:polyisoprenoid-binding protein YceI
VARYRIVPEESRVWIDARSSVHPIRSATDGLEGYVDLELGSDGVLDDIGAPSGKLSLSVDRLTSGNAFEDRELKRQIAARRYPTIEGVLREIRPSSTEGSYRVDGEVTFRGTTRPHVDEMTIRSLDERTIQLAGASRFDIREFGMEPPRVLMLRVQPEVDVRVEILAVKEN